MTCRKEPIDHPPEWSAGRQYGAVINIFPLCQNDSSTALAFDGSSGSFSTQITCSAVRNSLPVYPKKLTRTPQVGDLLLRPKPISLRGSGARGHAAVT